MPKGGKEQRVGWRGFVAGGKLKHLSFGSNWVENDTPWNYIYACSANILQLWTWLAHVAFRQPTQLTLCRPVPPSVCPCNTLSNILQRRRRRPVSMGRKLCVCELRFQCSQMSLCHLERLQNVLQIFMQHTHTHTHTHLHSEWQVCLCSEQSCRLLHYSYAVCLIKLARNVSSSTDSYSLAAKGQGARGRGQQQGQRGSSNSDSMASAL